VTDTLTAPAPAPPTAIATYTIADIARLAQASERHLHRLNDQGKIPGRIRGLGRLTRFGRAAIDQWLTGGSGVRG